MSYSVARLVRVNSPLRDFSEVCPSTLSPTNIRVAVRYVALSPLDIWRSRYGLLVKEEDLPKTLGGTFAGEVLEIGEKALQELKYGLKKGDLVSGWAGGLSGSMQEILDVEWWCVSKSEAASKEDLAAASTVGDSLTTAIWSLSAGGLSLSLPILEASPPPAELKENILVWGGTSSVGQFTLQILKHSGYKNVYATASSRHHQHVKQLGAQAVFDYNDENCISKISQDLAAKGLDGFQKVLDCIGDIDGSLGKIKELVSATKPTVVAAMLPFVKKGKGVYMTIDETGLKFNSNVEVVGVRTHFYHHSDYNRKNFQPSIIPNLLSEGVFKPNRVRLVGSNEGSLAERFQKGLRILEEGISGERVVVQVQ